MSSSSVLDDILRKLETLPPEKIVELEQARRKEGALFIPNPGGQTAAWHCQADELFFGGEPGGGKSMLLLGLAITEHTDSIIFRREFPQIKGLEKEAAKILGGRDGYNAQEKIWRIPGTKRTMEFGSVPHEWDVEKYQGRAHSLKCVAPGTLVVMAGGRMKPIESVRVGDVVETLSGPQRVTKLHTKKAQAVHVTAYVGARVVAQQVQGATHKLLAPGGWVAFGNEPTPVDAASTLDLSQRAIHQGRPLRPLSSHLGPQLLREFWQWRRRLVRSFGGLGPFGAKERYDLCRCGKSFLGQLPLDVRRAISQYWGHVRGLAHGQFRLGLIEHAAFLWAWLNQIPTSPLRHTCALVGACGIFGSKECLGGRKCGELCWGTCATHEPTATRRSEGQWQQRGCGQYLLGYQCALGWFAFLGQVSRESGCEEILGYIAASWRRLSNSVLPALQSLCPGQGAACSWQRSLGHASQGALCDPSLVGCQDDYSTCNDQYGARPRCTGEVYLSCLRPQAGAVVRTPKSLLGGDGDCTQECTRSLKSYRHPYTSGTHLTDARVRVAALDVVPVGEIELFDLTVEYANHYITDGGFINKNCFDEITHFSRAQYKYLTLWLRTSNPKERCRIVCTGNPPQNPEGFWVIEYWAPWLDETYPDPADPGELRWVAPLDDESDKELFFRSPEEAVAHLETLSKPPRDENGKVRLPRSRTFIPGKLGENPDLVRTGYQAVLAYASKEMRALASGNFDATLPDDPFQVIPTQWIIDAQKRWTPSPPTNAPMTAIGVDVAQGGDDDTILAPRHDYWFAPLVVVPGKQTPNPSDTAALVVKHRRDIAVVVVDCGGGYGGGVVDRLADNNIAAQSYKGAEAGIGRTKDRQHAFYNKRAETIWRFRELLDPDQPGGCPVALPNDPALRADLASYRFEVGPRGIKIEDKAEVKKRIGRSPDRGDAVVISWSEGQHGIRRGLGGPNGSRPSRPTVTVGYSNLKKRR